MKPLLRIALAALLAATTTVSADRSGTPLADAIQAGNRDAVRAILKNPAAAIRLL